MRPMLPEWMTKTEDYVPPHDGGAFYYKTLKSLGGVLSRLKAESGREGKRSLPAWLKLVVLLLYILFLSISRDRLITMGFVAVGLMALAMMPAGDIWSVLKPGFFAAEISAVLFLPKVIVDPESFMNSLTVVVKVLMSVIAVGIFNRRTQWNHVTGALRKFHVPGVVIFMIDITFRFIVLLGNLMTEMLTALQLRSVGRNRRKYDSVGGIMGTVFVRGAEMNREMYEAMQCRGFTDDYRGL